MGLTLCQPVSAYQQGSYLIFDIRDNPEEAGTTKRIAVASSLFKNLDATTSPGSTAKEKKSEFQTDISSFRSNEGDSLTTGIELLDDQKKEPETGSAFGESAPASSGFFFNY